MKIAIFLPEGMPDSFIVYTNNVMGELRKDGVEFVSFGQGEPLPADADLYWDPRSGGGNPPYAALRETAKPIVVTMHGIAPIALKPWEYFRGLRPLISGILANRRKLRQWKSFGKEMTIITVSEHNRQEFGRIVEAPYTDIVPIPLGADVELFWPSPEPPKGERYFFHVSNNQPRKNIGRILAAFKRLPRQDRPKLKILAPDIRSDEAEGIEVIGDRIPQEEVAPLYRNALAYVFPSLHEGFGLPIVEAMASGCPVITGNETACGEVAGDAGLLVDPRSVPEISEAMLRISTDPALYERLRAAGLQRAREFTWHKTATAHLAVFRKVLNGGAVESPPEPEDVLAAETAE